MNDNLCLVIACDPTSERIVYFDKDLKQIGECSLKSVHDQQYSTGPSNQPQKVYPYAAQYLSDATSLVLTHRNESCHIEEYQTATACVLKVYNLPPGLKSYSFYVDSTRKCLIADQANHCLVSIDKDSNIEQHRFNSLREPRSMTFLSTGTLCVTSWNKSSDAIGGICVISEENLNDQP